MSDTPRTVYWQTVVLTPTGAIPGTYSNVTITIGADGRIDAISAPSTFADSDYVADIPARDALIGTSMAGRLVTVADSGNTYRATYVFDGSAFQPAANDPRNSLRYGQYSIAHATTNNLGSPIQTNAIIRSVLLQILTPYTGGTSIQISGQAGAIYMAGSDNDPTASNTYQVDISSNTAVGAGNAQLQALVSGLPVSGSALITVEYMLPI